MNTSFDPWNLYFIPTGGAVHMFAVYAWSHSFILFDIISRIR